MIASLGAQILGWSLILAIGALFAVAGWGLRR